MRKGYVILALLLLLIGIGAKCQVIRGIVTDAQSRKPLPFVNIGIVNKNRGVISKDNGEFEIRLDNIERGEAITFSLLGYETKSIQVQALEEVPLKVSLTPITYQLPSVTVVGTKISNPVKLGRFLPGKTTFGHSGVGNFGFGGEWGIRIFNNNTTNWIQDVSFHLRFNTLDSVLFRINLYKLQNDVPGESLLQHPLYVKSYKGDNWITRNVEEQRLVIDEDIIVSFEVVQLWYSARGENHLFFTHGKGYPESKTYVRRSSQDQWLVQEGPPITLFITVQSIDEK